MDDTRPIGQRSARAPRHVGPFDLVKLAGVLRMAVSEAERRALREEIAVTVYLVRDAAMGGGQGVAIRPSSETAPDDSEVYREVAAPLPLTEGQEHFLSLYTRELSHDVTTKRDQYAYGPEDVPGVARRMVRALVSGTGNKDSNAIRRVCGKVGVPYTYEGIRKALHGT